MQVVLKSRSRYFNAVTNKLNPIKRLKTVASYGKMDFMCNILLFYIVSMLVNDISTN